MKKSKTFLAVMSSLALTFTLVLAGCPDPNGDDTGTGGDQAIENVSISSTELLAGATLTASATGTNGSSASGVSYQWQRSNTENGIYTDISGATNRQYTITADDEGKYLKVKAENSLSTVYSAVKGPVESNRAAKPVAEPAGGEVAPGQEITLTSATTGALIYYTLDGTAPTSSSSQYSASSKPKITASGTLKAIAIKASRDDSEVLTVEYTVMPGVAFSKVTNTAPFTSESIYAVTYASGKFVAAGNSKIAYSSNGTSWTAASTSGGVTSMHGVTYGNSKFVAVGYNGNMASSSDGTSWTGGTLTYFGTKTINAVAYGAGKYVAAGDEGTIAYSSNGTDWTGITPGTGEGKTQFESGISSSVYGVTYGDDKFVAVGTGGKIAYSADGISWTAAASSPFTSVIYGVTYGGSSGNEKFIAVGAGGKMASSPDGETWTAITLPFLFTDTLNSIAWGGNKFVAVGRSGVMVYSNAAGTSWVKIEGGTGAGKSQFDTASSSSINSIVYGGGKFLAAGSGGTSSARTGEMAVSE
jgi:hypothetical protein